MTDPYAVLGVNRNASDTEIKNAYRELAKKYHPDQYTNTPLSDLADEKMKEINAAYDAVMNERRDGPQKHSAGSSYAGGSSYADVRNLISTNRMADADLILSGVPESKRNAEWYFLKGTLLYRKGWMDQAYNYMKRACAMDPGNIEYKSAFNHMQNQRGGNFGGYNTNTNSSAGGCSACDMCCSLLCADSCCECLGGDLISCC